MKCRAKGCTRDADGGLLCRACHVEFDVLLRHELGKKIGHAPSEAEMDIFMARVLVNAPKEPR